MVVRRKHARSIHHRPPSGYSARICVGAISSEREEVMATPVRAMILLEALGSRSTTTFTNGAPSVLLRDEGGGMSRISWRIVRLATMCAVMLMGPALPDSVKGTGCSHSGLYRIYG